MLCQGNDCRNDVDELNEDGLCGECADAQDTVDQALAEKRRETVRRIIHGSRRHL